MEQLNKIKILLESTTDLVKFWVSNDHIRSLMWENINGIKQELAEIEKIQNYTDAAESPAEKPYKEMVSHPSHYQGNKHECIDVMLDVFGKEKVSAFCELNAFKYLWRSDSKGTDIQDKRKAIWYLDKYNELNKEEP